MGFADRGGDGGTGALEVGGDTRGVKAQPWAHAGAQPSHAEVVGVLVDPAAFDAPSRGDLRCRQQPAVVFDWRPDRFMLLVDKVGDAVGELVEAARVQPDDDDLTVLVAHAGRRRAARVGRTGGGTSWTAASVPSLQWVIRARAMSM